MVRHAGTQSIALGCLTKGKSMRLSLGTLYFVVFLKTFGLLDAYLFPTSEGVGQRYLQILLIRLVRIALPEFGRIGFDDTSFSEEFTFEPAFQLVVEELFVYTAAHFIYSPVPFVGECKSRFIISFECGTRVFGERESVRSRIFDKGLLHCTVSHRHFFCTTA